MNTGEHEPVAEEARTQPHGRAQLHPGTERRYFQGQSPDLPFDGLLRAQFSLRMQKATQQLSNNSQLRKVRRDIARVRTVMGEKGQRP